MSLVKHVTICDKKWYRCSIDRLLARWGMQMAASAGSIPLSLIKRFYGSGI